MKEVEGFTSIERKIPLQCLQDLLICALEGGSNYWYCNADYSIPEDKIEAVKDASDGVFKGYWAPFYGGNLYLEVKYEGDELPRWNGEAFEKIEAGEGVRWTIRQADLERGLRTMSEKYPRHMADVIKNNEDADTGDVFLQCVCFGDIIYG